MALSKIGDHGFNLTGESREYTSESGYVTIRRYAGPFDAKDAFFASQKALVDADIADSVREDQEDGEAIVEVRFADDDGSGGGFTDPALNTVWEVIPQDFYKSIRQLGTAVNARGIIFNKDAKQAALEAIRAAVERGEQIIPPAVEPDITYHNLLLRGVDEFVRTGATLRKSIRVGRRSTLRGIWENVDRAWKLAGEPGSPDISGIGASAIVGAINSMDDADPALKQWLKRGPHIQLIGRARYSIVQEWWFAAQWSEALYNGDAGDGNP